MFILTAAVEKVSALSNVEVTVGKGAAAEP